MDEVEKSVRQKRSDDNSQMARESKNNCGEEANRHSGFGEHAPRRTAHRCEQVVLRGNHGEHCGVKGTITVEAAHSRKKRHSQRQQKPARHVITTRPSSPSIPLLALGRAPKIAPSNRLG